MCLYLIKTHRGPIAETVVDILMLIYKKKSARALVTYNKLGNN